MSISKDKCLVERIFHIINRCIFQIDIIVAVIEQTLQKLKEAKGVDRTITPSVIDLTSMIVQSVCKMLEGNNLGFRYQKSR